MSFLKTPKKYLFLFTLCFITSVASFGQTFSWANRVGGPSNDNSFSIAVDGSGNTYTTGSFVGTVDFDPGPGTFYLTAASQDVFVTKFNALGNFVWARKLGGAYEEYGRGIAVDSYGNVVITGSFKGTADFDPGAGSFTLSSNGEWDIFICKLSSSGNFMWAASHGGPEEQDHGNAIACDASGNVYFTGSFKGTVDFDPGPETFNLTSDYIDVFVSKLNASGKLVWAKKMGGIFSDEGYAITVDASGNVYTTGYKRGAGDFDPGPDVYTLGHTEGNGDCFISKLDTDGNFVWAKAFLASHVYYSYGYSIAVDTIGNVFIGGFFNADVDFNPGSGAYFMRAKGMNDGFISKLDPAGNFLWAKPVGGCAQEDHCYAVAVDGFGNVYATGSFQNAGDFDPGPASYELYSAGGGIDVFISKFTTDGLFQWAKKIGGTSNDVAYGMAVDKKGNIYTTGNFAGNGDFNPEAGGFMLGSAGGNDGFIHKMSQITDDIAILPLSTSPLCAGVSIAIPYTVSGVFNAGNVFIAQLSDATGSFASPIIIGGATATSAGTINAVIPKNMPTGSNYRIRIVSNSPAVVSFDNGSGLTINAVPVTPSITSTNPTICENESVILTSSAFDGNRWFLDGTPIMLGYNHMIPATESGNYTLQVVEEGCTSDGSAPVKVTVNPIPATPTIAATTATTFCQGETVVLTSSSSSGNQWYKDGMAVDNSINKTFTAAATGVYTVVTNANGCTSAPSAGVTVNVKAVPEVKLTANGNPVFCQGGSLTLTSAASAGNQWYRNGGPINQATNQTLTVTENGNYTLKVTQDGCTSLPSEALKVTVNPIPFTPVVSATTATTFCQGGSVLLVSPSITGNQWYRDGAPIDHANGQNIAVREGGNYTLKVSQEGCTSAASETLIIKVNPLPAIPIIAATASSFCQGETVVLTSSSLTGNQWYRNEALINQASDQSLTAKEGGNYTLRVTQNGCTSAASAALMVTANALPATPVIAAATATSFCQGGSVLLTSSSTTGNLWYKDDVAINGATAQTYAATQSGNYSVQVSANGCMSAKASPVTITVKQTPAKPVITREGNTLTSSAATGNQWYLNGVAINDASGKTYPMQASGSYTVQTTQNGCTALSDAYHFVATAIVSPGAWDSEVYAYPNPVVKMLYIKNAGSRKLQVQLVDTYGKVIYSGPIITTTTTTIDMSGYAAGVYRLLLTDSNKQQTINYNIFKQ